MTRRRLSSRLTVYWALIFPLLWSVGFGIGTLAFFLTPKLPPPASGGPPPPIIIPRLMFLTFWLVGSGFSLWMTFNFKRVFRDEAALYVARPYSDEEERVPLFAIASVREMRKFNVNGKYPIVVELREPYACGRRIVFLPTGKRPFAWPWNPRPHPILVELRTITEDGTPDARGERARNVGM